MEEDIRYLEFMSVDRKEGYCKLLALMVSLNKTEGKTVALYRLLGQIRLNIESRILLQDYISNPTDNKSSICLDLMRDLNDEEKNLIRFSLMKDLIIIMKAGEETSLEEKKLFNELRELLQVPVEYIGFFEDEYENDQRYLDENTDENEIYELARHQATLASSVGIPLGYLYYKGYLKEILEYKKSDKLLVKLQRLGLIKRKPYKIKLKHLLTALSLGVLTYSIGKQVINKRIDTENELKGMVIKRARSLHNRALTYLSKDIEYISEQIKLEDNQDKIDILQLRMDLLKNTLRIMKNSKPILL